MGRYLVRRLVWAMVLFIAVTLVTYIIFFVVPADPARLAAGKNPTPDQIERVRHTLGLDQPVYLQYWDFLKRLVLDRSLGTSFTTRTPINTIVGNAIPVTVSLVIGGAILWMTLA